MLSSVALRLKALSPFHLALLVLAALALLGSSTAVASNLITGADVKDRSLTGRDLVAGTITHTNLKNGSVLSQDIKDGHVTSGDLKDGTVQSTDLSSDVRAQLAKSGKDGAKGDAGPHGPEGDAGPAGAPGGFLVKDADNTTAGTLLAAPSDANHLVYGSLYYKGRIYDADFKTGILRVWNKNTNLWYTTPDCTGTVYAQQGGPQMVLANVTQPGKLYEYVGADEALTFHSIVVNGACQTTTTSTTAARVEPVPVAEMPPTLQGPLSIVPVG